MKSWPPPWAPGDPADIFLSFWVLFTTACPHQSGACWFYSVIHGPALGNRGREQGPEQREGSSEVRPTVTEETRGERHVGPDGKG